MNKLIKLLSIISIIQNITIHSLYFQLQEGKQKCFYQDTIQQQLIISYYEFYDQLKEQKYDQNAGIRVQVKNDRNELVYQNLLTQKEGKFLIFNRNSLYLMFCYMTSTSHWITASQLVRFKVRNVYQEQTERTESIANSTKLQDLDELINLYEQINKQTSLYIKKINGEESMNQQLLDQNKEINSSISLWTGLQILTMIVSVIIQVTFLGKFFRQNNII